MGLCSGKMGREGKGGGKCIGLMDGCLLLLLLDGITIGVVGHELLVVFFLAFYFFLVGSCFLTCSLSRTHFCLVLL